MMASLKLLVLEMPGMVLCYLLPRDTGLVLHKYDKYILHWFNAAVIFR